MISFNDVRNLSLCLFIYLPIYLFVFLPNYVICKVNINQSIVIIYLSIIHLTYCPYCHRQLGQHPFIYRLFYLLSVCLSVSLSPPPPPLSLCLSLSSLYLSFTLTLSGICVFLCIPPKLFFNYALL